jgi:hypothetical protein
MFNFPSPANYSDPAILTGFYPVYITRYRNIIGIKLGIITLWADGFFLKAKYNTVNIRHPV